MLVVKVIGIGLIGTVLSILIKQHKPEMSIFIPILTAAAILGLCVPHINAVIKVFTDIADSTGIEIEHIKIVIKIIGIAYICQFASDICSDAGEKAISGKIELGGKFAIITMSMPIIQSMLELTAKIINF